MIKKMTKYSFVVFHKEVEDFLKNLQEIGVVDVTRQKRAIDSFSMEKFEEIAQYNAAANQLKRIKEEALKKNVEIPAGKPEQDNLLAFFNSQISQKETLKNRLFTLKGEYALALPWGSFTEKDLDNLKSLGYTPYFYAVSTQKYDKEWENLYPIYVLNEYEGKTYFTVLMEGNEKPKMKLQEAVFPAVSADILEKEIKECEDLTGRV